MSTAVLSALLLGLASPEETLHEPLPAPVVVRPVILEPMPPPLGFPVFPLPPVAYRPSAYEHWQYRAVSGRGFMRARVIYHPWGAYYAHDGKWYPWTYLDDGSFKP